jgi:hypothetical protein
MKKVVAMKLVRPKAFETNSSSTHAITIPRKLDKSLYGIRPYIYFGIDEFGWSYDKYDLTDYIWTAICDIYPQDEKINEYKQKIINILSPYYKEIEFEEPKWEEDYDDEGNLKWRYLDSMQGYVDHANELTEFLDEIFENEELFLNAILSGYVRTGNDNDEGYNLDEYDNDPNYYHYYKGN